MKIRKDMKDMGRYSQENVGASQGDKEMSKAREKRQSREGKIDLNKVVLEYLLKNNFTSALEAFKKELTTRPDENAYKQTLKTLLNHFDSGNGKEFFTNWQKAVEEGDIDDALKDDLAKLEFYFQIYFCIFWIHSKGKNLEVESILTKSKSLLRKSANSKLFLTIKAQTYPKQPNS